MTIYMASYSGVIGMCDAKGYGLSLKQGKDLSHSGLK